MKSTKILNKMHNSYLSPYAPTDLLTTMHATLLEYMPPKKCTPM